MARSKDIQYVCGYTYGSAVRKVELPEKQKAEPAPKPKAAEVPSHRLGADRLCLVCVAAAAVMLICMVTGYAQVSRANSQVARLQAYVANLEAENTSLEMEYQHGYDLAQVRVAAETMGMIPAEQAQHMTISVPEPVAEEEPTWWENLLENFNALLA